jgi:hypothetical protein
MVRPPSARRLRRRYTNPKYPLVILRFEDGHEIRFKQGEGKTFDAFAGEVIKVVVLWDPGANDREVVSVLRAEQFEEDR